MHEHSNNPKKVSSNNDNKGNVFELKPEKWFFNMILVGLWQGENEIAAFVVSEEVWKDETQLLEIVNSIMLNTGNKVGRWL